MEKYEENMIYEVTHTFHLSTGEADAGKYICELELNLLYIENSMLSISA